VTWVYVKGNFFTLYLYNNIWHERNCRCAIIVNLFITCSFACLLRIQSIELLSVSLVNYWHSHICSHVMWILVMFWPVDILEYSWILEHNLLRQLWVKVLLVSCTTFSHHIKEYRPSTSSAIYIWTSVLQLTKMNARTVVFELNFCHVENIYCMFPVCFWPLAAT
jgi:uncharacterized membrane protein YwzB